MGCGIWSGTKPWATHYGVLLLLGVTLIGCASAPGKRGFPIPNGYRYRPATPQEAPDTAASRKKARQARDAILDSDPLDPRAYTEEVTPPGPAPRPRILLVGSDGPTLGGDAPGQSVGGYQVPGRNPDSQMPWEFFLGHAAHRLIAYMYRVRHPQSRAFYNTQTIVTILAQAEIGDESRLLPRERMLRPDITDTVELVVFEIRPWNERGLQEGRQDVQVYLAALNRAVAPSMIFSGGTNFQGEILIRFARGQHIWRLKWQTTEPGVIQYRWTRSQQRFESEAAAYEAGQWVELTVREMQQYGGWVAVAVEGMVSLREHLADFSEVVGIFIDVVGGVAVGGFTGAIVGGMGSGTKVPRPRPPAQGGGQVIPLPARPAPASPPAKVPAASGM